jgi:hypothetical protein
MPKYYSLLLTTHISKTPEGYLICRDVPICRSGFQLYRGKELVRFPGYQASWGLDPETMYKVLRPKEEVLHPDTIASFNGKTVVNEHPEKDVVYIDNEGELNCGHAQDIKRGEDLPPTEELPEGAVTLAADLHIKDPELVEKIYPKDDPASGVRDISCGYSLKLKRLADGTLVMYCIRGNHIAVVEKGRAGEMIAIQDSVPIETMEILVAIGDAAPPEIKEKRTPIMSIRELIFGRGVKAIMPDASPDEVASMMKEMEEPDKRDGKPKPAKDSMEKQDELAAEHPHRVAAHAALDRCLDARGADDHMGKDAFGKPAHLDSLQRELAKFIEKEEGASAAAETAKAEPAKAEPEPEPKAEPEVDAGPAPEIEELKEEEPPKEEEVEPEREPEGDADADAEPSDPEDEEEKPATDAEEVKEQGESVLKQANDSVRNYLRATKPLVASIVAKPRSKWTVPEATMVDSYNKAVRNVNEAGPAYRVLAKPKVPSRIPPLAKDAEAAAAANKLEEDKIAAFYEGVPWAKGKAVHDAYLKTKGSK